MNRPLSKILWNAQSPVISPSYINFTERYFFNDSFQIPLVWIYHSQRNGWIFSIHSEQRKMSRRSLHSIWDKNEVYSKQEIKVELLYCITMKCWDLLEASFRGEGNDNWINEKFIRKKLGSDRSPEKIILPLHVIGTSIPKYKRPNCFIIGIVLSVEGKGSSSSTQINLLNPHISEC